MALKNKTSVSCSLVGLPNVGKSTLFNILTKTFSAAAANFPFCTIDPNVGCCIIKDDRLDVLSEISKSNLTVYSQIKVVDVAGLVRGASQGAGLGNQFLASVRETDLIIEVVRCFADTNTTHVMGRVDPLEDIEIIETEFLLADLKMAQDIKDRLQKKKNNDVKVAKICNVLEKVISNLSNEVFIKNICFEKDEVEIVDSYNFLTSKPIIYALNISENDVDNEDYVSSLITKIDSRNNAVAIPFCASIEEMCIDVDSEKKKEMFESYNYINTSDEILKRAYNLLGLISFFTSGEKETRSWTIVNGTLAQEAAGKIHKDIEKGFIRAEVVEFEDFVKYKGRQNAKEKGIAKLVGKEYVVSDGDVILFLHKI